MGKLSRKKIERKTNPQMPELISSLKKKSYEENALIWKDIAKRLEKPRRTYAQVNLSKINRNSIDNELILVPGKVLGAGELKHAVKIAALGFSETAKQKVAEVGGKCISIESLLDENPSGSGVRILK
ncbi:50S ribosomal protein L18e [Methanosalsum natronophilum]|uniref:Large ribosomal subunit protein eL18 n=1 Tax=Methanosalsum natronophilum TaxID=768733 RepID=A0A3R7XUL2_9EURY|nr:50S ribosomal protein L18e [Methanosalsum natronophilum]MCS3924642.1 large subunit ribosomal protein L18e [Methanosalsum natronophilum]RQD85267.1 MAG: 50S ribosomal protein L18e [Methanosalsum natronophilum]